MASIREIKRPELPKFFHQNCIFVYELTFIYSIPYLQIHKSVRTKLWYSVHFLFKNNFLETLLLSNQYIEYFTVFVHLFWPKIHQKENLIYLNKILEKKKLCSLSTLYIKSFSLYLLHLLCSSLSGVSNFPHCEFVLYKIRCSFINYTMHDELL